jgi:hypothetical protein
MAYVLMTRVHDSHEISSSIAEPHVKVLSRYVYGYRTDKDRKGLLYARHRMQSPYMDACKHSAPTGWAHWSIRGSKVNMPRR